LVPNINAHRDNHGLSDQTFFLILDGHAAHYCDAALEEFHANNIVCLFLPPHTSHLIQPLDRGLFAVLKKKFALRLLESSTYDARKPTLAKRIDLLMETWNNIATPNLIEASFKHAGFVPFDKKRVTEILRSGGKHDMHKPAEIILQNEVTAEILFGKGAIDVLTFEAECLSGSGTICKRKVETRYINKDGKRSKIVTTTCTASTSEDIRSDLRSLKDVFADFKREEREKQTRMNPGLAGNFSDAPTFHSSNFNIRMAGRLKLMDKVQLSLALEKYKEHQYVREIYESH
jgi:hypothetical protein